MNGEQQENLERVTSRIARAILDFCSCHQRFYAEELRAYVIRETGIAAPGSADRVLRHLRQSGRLNYRVLSRRESLYEMISMGPQPQEQPHDTDPREPAACC
jgi:hypothetical protein